MIRNNLGISMMCFQRYLTKGERPILTVGFTIPWAGGLEGVSSVEGSSHSTRIHLYLLPDPCRRKQYDSLLPPWLNHHDGMDPQTVNWNQSFLLHIASIRYFFHKSKKKNKWLIQQDIKVPHFYPQEINIITYLKPHCGRILLLLFSYVDKEDTLHGTLSLMSTDILFPGGSAAQGHGEVHKG